MPMAFRDIIEEHYGKKKVFKFLVANIAPLLIEFGKLGFIATNLYRLPSEGANLANYIYPGQILFTLTQMVLTYRFGQMKLPWIRAFIISVYNETFLLAVTGLVLQIVTYASSPDTWVSLGYQFTLLGYELARFQDMALFCEIMINIRLIFAHHAHSQISGGRKCRIFIQFDGYFSKKCNRKI